MTDGLLDLARMDEAALYRHFDSSPGGLTEQAAQEKLGSIGPNRIADDVRLSVLREILRRLMTPLNGLLLGLAVTSWALSDYRSAIVIAIMVLLSVGLGYVQEHRSSMAAARLKRMVQVHSSVKRATPDFVEMPLEVLVPGDIVRLSAGDLIPADLRLLSAHDLHVNESSLTGEAMPVEKRAAPDADASAPFDAPNLCFMGSSVVSGFAEGIILKTGRTTYFGEVAKQIVGADTASSFDRGLNQFVGLMLRFMAVLVPLVFIINGVTKHNWLEALFFAVAVAVGLAPEMLPMVVTMNLARGAIAMSRKRAIVKRLNAIQNFGAMDVLCTDKTGTLTQDRVVLKLHLDVEGRDNRDVLAYAWLNSRFESGLRNLMDEAILEHGGQEEHPISAGDYTKLDELPFDFMRRRVSVVVRRPEGEALLVCKGAVEEVLSICTQFRKGDEVLPFAGDQAEAIRAVANGLNRDGFRVLAIACRTMPALAEGQYSVNDERDLTLIGFAAFLDPPKETAGPAIADLQKAGITVKVLTGDNDLVTAKICRDVGLDVGQLLLGRQIEAMSDTELAAQAEVTQVFAKVSPTQKARIIAALQANGHVVGFLGDGINDGPALKVADVGISVDTAVDIAKESADIILLEKSLAVLGDGVTEGRRVFANIIKYIRMGASSNFGNMFSVLGASVLLPFLPMAPLQVLTNNLLYDFSQTTIPTDNVDPEYLTTPRRWEIGNIARFMLFIGPMSSIFDYATYFTMLFVFDAWHDPALFQTGWFVESLLTQTLIIHIIRTARIPFLQSRASNALIATTLIICAIGVALPFSPLGATLGFKPLPALYWPILAGFLLAYGVLTHIVKVWFFRRWGG
ncbi:magnesium-translocating P-type ATPase [Novosphingobium sediminicola]|uniref:Magnesium-transporting ATPase, P-type 1 n=1 Tax=Novosphingobium sediminicola TaxID=563162 RepID=A0A7W6G9S6_9SPHN|nr:magnesium-translocating P-type ATPase [Novosphingobium sediminicola]MBB3957372.1 Mg2+-importing ATPase [Novosphingobium sediminicola]